MPQLRLDKVRESLGSLFYFFFVFHRLSIDISIVYCAEKLKPAQGCHIRLSTRHDYVHKVDKNE